MPAPRKRFTTQSSTSRLRPLAAKHPKSIANPNQLCSSQLTENKSASQKSIANFLALPALTQEGRAPQCGGRMGRTLLSFHMVFPTPDSLYPTPPRINRHTYLAESCVSYSKQGTGAHSTRYTKGRYLASRGAVRERRSLASPDAIPTRPAPSARHSASPVRKAWLNQKTCVSTFCAASSAQAFGPARLSIFQLSYSPCPCRPASVPRDGEINCHNSGICSPAFPRSVSHFSFLIETPPRIEIAIT